MHHGQNRQQASSYNLKNRAHARVADGEAYVFVRRHGAPLPRKLVEGIFGIGGGLVGAAAAEIAIHTLPHDGDTVYMGHVAWGFRFNDTTYMCGSLENLSGNPVTFGDRDDSAKISASYWSTYVKGGPDELIDQLRTMSTASRQFNTPMTKYDEYKVVPVRPGKPNEAEARALAWAGHSKVFTTYSAFFQNCLDATYSVLDSYGASGQPWGAVAPNWFFDRMSGSAHTI